MGKLRLGFAMCGSYCTFAPALAAAERLSRLYDMTPILSDNAAVTDSRFGTAAEFARRLETMSGIPVITSIPAAEPIGPKRMCDVYIVAPITGNSLSKLANGQFDTPALLGAKSHIRNERPLVLAVSTNDGLGAAAQNIGRLLSWRNVYFVPFGQDDPIRKPRSLVADFAQIPKTIAAALSGVQLQPMLTAKG